jgi:hypothetical protein
VATRYLPAGARGRIVGSLGGPGGGRADRVQRHHDHNRLQQPHSGNSNCGHPYGTHLLDDKKKALLEYLKTL